MENTKGRKPKMGPFADWAFPGDHLDSVTRELSVKNFKKLGLMYDTPFGLSISLLRGEEVELWVIPPSSSLSTYKDRTVVELFATDKESANDKYRTINEILTDLHRTTLQPQRVGMISEKYF